MSDSSVLATPNTATLSVMRTFMSVPSRDLIDSIGPSTASIVPRIRTVGAGWAQASDENKEAASSDAAKERVIVGTICDMATLSRVRQADQFIANPEPCSLFREGVTSAG